MRLSSPYDRMLAPVYVPTLAVDVSQQALLILLPLHVLALGGSPAFAATVVGLRGVGVLLFDVPAGMLAARLGDKPVLLGGLGLLLLGLLALGLTSAPWLVGAAALVLGAGQAAWMLGRQSYIAQTCPQDEVGRAIAVMGGVQRAGAFIGPAGGGFLAAAFGYHAAFLCGAAGALLAAGFVLAFTEVHAVEGAPGGSTLAGMGDVLRNHRRAFATAGVAALALQLMRAGRQLLVPLFGESVGLDVAAIGLVYSISSALDMSLFYPVGLLVDRKGRKWSAVPSMASFVLGLALLPWVRDFAGLLGVGLVLGLANGLGTGIVMIMGADIAGAAGGRGRFLGVWRLIGDVGISAGPLLTSALVDAAGIAAAALSVATLGLGGVLVMLFLVDETRPRRRAATEAAVDASEHCSQKR
jgi:MFS family permease